jgi:DNA mismatch endonuclease (patch repair protein)
MQLQRSKDTHPEVRLRSALHRLGLRYRLHVPLLPGVRRTADIVFGPARVVVDVRGCFWHACPEHGGRPTQNAQWWESKLARNVQRDEETTARLEEAGWYVMVVWEHDGAEEAARHVCRTVRARRSQL